MTEIQRQSFRAAFVFQNHRLKKASSKFCGFDKKSDATSFGAVHRSPSPESFKLLWSVKITFS